jgi:hypothetical protein
MEINEQMFESKHLLSVCTSADIRDRGETERRFADRVNKAGLICKTNDFSSGTSEISCNSIGVLSSLC